MLVAIIRKYSKEDAKEDGLGSIQYSIFRVKVLI